MQTQGFYGLEETAGRAKGLGALTKGWTHPRSMNSQKHMSLPPSQPHIKCSKLGRNQTLKSEEKQSLTQMSTQQASCHLVSLSPEPVGTSGFSTHTKTLHAGLGTGRTHTQGSPSPTERVWYRLLS